MRLTYVFDATPSPLPSRPREFAFRPVRPNPFRTSTELVDDLPRPASVDLRIYDVAGRLVRTLEPGVMRPAGTYRVTWSGRTDGGETAATGICWSRIVARDYVATRMLTLLR